MECAFGLVAIGLIVLAELTTPQRTNGSMGWGCFWMLLTGASLYLIVATLAAAK